MAGIEYFAVATRADIAPGEVFVTFVGGKRIAVCNLDGNYYAVEDSCSHDGSSFDQTGLEGCEIYCPRHGAVFDVRSGAVLSPPADSPIDTFHVRLSGETIEVGLVF